MTRWSDDAALEALAHGELQDDELAFLRALAGDDPEATERLEAFRPLDEDARARIAEGLEARLRTAPPSPSPHEPAPDEPTPHEPAPRGWKPRLVTGGALVAMAAAATLVLLADAPGASPAPEVALPRFELEVAGRVAEARGANGAESPTGEPLRIAREGTLELVLRPPRRGVEARAALFVREGPEDPLRLLARGPERSPAGGFRWRLPATALGFGEGAGELVVAYGRAEPDAETVAGWLAEGDERARRIAVAFEEAITP